MPTEVFRADPGRTAIPYWLVDAVCEVPFGSYPGEMPYEYGADEEHIAEWLEAEKDPATFEAFLDKYIYGTRDFVEYMTLTGGMERRPALRRLDPLHE